MALVWGWWRILALPTLPPPPHACARQLCLSVCLSPEHRCDMFTQTEGRGPGGTAEVGGTQPDRVTSVSPPWNWVGVSITALQDIYGGGRGVTALSVQFGCPTPPPNTHGMMREREMGGAQG